MDLQEVIIVLALEAALEKKREENRRLNELLRAAQLEFQEKFKECEMFKRKKQDMVAVEAAMQKLAHDFVEAIDENGNIKNAEKFDEKAMMNAIAAFTNDGGYDSGSGGNVGFAAKDGKKDA